MEIKVIGTGCEKCSQLYQNVQQALSLLGLEAEVQKVEDLMEIVRLGIMTSPSLMINGKLAVSGHVANVNAIMDLLKRQG